MKFQLCSVFDSAVGTYSPPFCVRALPEAIRSFVQEAKSPQSRISKSPADYTLFHLGTFDDERAFFDIQAAPVRIMGANEVQPD